ncbi:MAG: glycoside hydrolase family 24 protein [Janthinobacterium lividum]
MPRITTSQAGGTNRLAFLDMIAISELTSALIAETDDGYDVLVGATAAHPLTFPSYATHPNILNAALDSTAAGRYQLLHHWYVAYAALLHLPDFSPISQDLIALQQIRERRALPMIDAGNFAGAVSACSNIWASLTGSKWGQHTNPLAFLQSAYVASGGIVA